MQDFEIRFGDWSPGKLFAFGFSRWWCLCHTSASVGLRTLKSEASVADEKKAMIPGADVVVTHVATGTSRSTITNDVGFYSVPLLKEGEYQVKCGMPGFAAQQAQYQAGSRTDLGGRLQTQGGRGDAGHRGRGQCGATAV